MTGPRKDARGAAAEGVSLRINEGAPVSRAPAWRLTYLGDGVVSLPGIGVFARDVSASVDGATARRLEGDPRWLVERRTG